MRDQSPSTRGARPIATVLAATLATLAAGLAAPSADAAALSRPDPRGTATEVRVRVFVIDVASIDDASQTYKADLLAAIRWRDPRLAFAAVPGTDEVRVLSLSEVWQPDLLLVNRREATRVYPDQVRVSPDGTVLYRQRFLVTLASPLELRRFPFDRQTLAVRLVSLYPADEVQLVPEPVQEGPRPDFTIAGWSLEVGDFTADQLESPGGQQLSRLVLSLPASRDTRYYYWKLFVPLGLIVFMAWSVFSLDHTQLGPRIGVSTASIFTLIAFQLSLGRLLPPIAYLTRADMFVLGTSVLVFLALAETITISRLNAAGRQETSRKVDQVARPLYAALFLVVAFLSIKG